MTATDRPPRNRSRRERGQVLVMFAILLAGILAFAALAVDVGFFMYTRTDLQASVDAMALAGGQELCGKASCSEKAEEIAAEYGPKNDIRSSDKVEIVLGVDCDGKISSRHDMITVRVVRNTPTFLARVIGITDADIPACATARKWAIGGGSGVRPFGIEERCLAAGGFYEGDVKATDTIVLKFDSGVESRNCNMYQGNFGTIAIDGPGSTLYLNAIKYGSKSVVCAYDVTDPTCQSYTFNTLTGDKIGPTRSGIRYLMDNTPAACSTWAQVWDSEVGDIKSACDPWKYGYYDTYLASRFIVVPIVRGMWDSGGTNQIIVVKFAIVWLETGCSTGNNCDVKARFIRSQIQLPDAVKVDLTEGAPMTITTLYK